MKTIVISNFKGGTGKTTTAVNLAYGLVEQGYKVLAIDLDAQANLTTMFGLGDVVQVDHCISGVLRGETVDLPYFDVSEKLSVLPSHNVAMIGLEIDLQLMLRGGDLKLKQLLESPQFTERNFDYVVIDLPPALNMLSVNAYVVADRIVVPINTDYLSTAGLMNLSNRLSKDLGVNITDVLFTKAELNQKLSKDVIAFIEQEFKQELMECIIPKNVKLQEQGVEHKSIFEHAPNSTGAESYRAFVNELLSRINPN